MRCERSQYRHTPVNDVSRSCCLVRDREGGHRVPDGSPIPRGAGLPSLPRTGTRQDRRTVVVWSLPPMVHGDNRDVVGANQGASHNLVDGGLVPGSDQDRRLGDEHPEHMALSKSKWRSDSCLAVKNSILNDISIHELSRHPMRPSLDFEKDPDPEHRRDRLPHGLGAAPQDASGHGPNGPGAPER